MNKSKTIVLIFIQFFLVTFIFAQEKKYSAIINSLESELPKLMQQENVNGVAIALMSKEDIIWSKSFGHTDKTKKHPITLNTNFSIQSATKTFTSIALLLSVQNGKVNIKQPISNYLGNYRLKSIWEKSPQNNITVENLLNHTSGLSHETFKGNNYDLEKSSYQAHINSISNTWQQYPTGTRQKYSNLGISLAGLIIEKVEKKNYSDALKKMILEPLGMESSFFITEKNNLSLNTAKGYSNSFDFVPKIPDGLVAAGGLYSNITDLSKFSKLVLNNGKIDNKALLNPEYFNMLTKLPFQSEGQIQGYGLGLEVKNFNGYQIYMMPGRGFGFIGGIVFFPEEELSLIVLTNNEDTSIPMFAVSTIMQNLNTQSNNSIHSTFSITKEAKKATLSQISNFEGEYLDEYNNAFILKIENNKPVVSINSEKIETDFLICHNKLYLQTPYSIFEAVFDEKNKLKYIKDVYDSEITYDFNFTPNSKNEIFKSKWNNFIGEYEMKKWGVSYEKLRIHKKENSLFIGNRKLEEIKNNIFRDCNGNILDFSSKTITYKNIKLNKI